MKLGMGLIVIGVVQIVSLAMLTSLNNWPFGIILSTTSIMLILVGTSLTMLGD